MKQIRKAVTGLTPWQIVSIVFAVALVGGGIAMLLHNFNESDFHPAYTSLSPEDAAAVVQKLKESGIDYRLSDGGATIMIASERTAETRLALAAAGLPKSGRIGFELFDKTNFGATELVEHVNYQRALEGELERSMMTMSQVLQARVHLTLSKASVFLDQQQPAKASVMVKLRPGTTLSGPQVIAVSNLVASAVEGLNPEAVAILDMDGNLLNRPRRTNTDDAQVTAEALDVRRQLERDLVSKMSETLEPLLGANMFRAGASVECDLTSGDQQEEVFDPEKSVMVSSQKTEEEHGRSSAGGIPGTAANLPNPPANAQSASVGGPSNRTENVTYQSSRTIRHTRIPQGVVKRMSLSVLVGQQARWEGDAKNRHRVAIPPDQETLTKIRELVSGATGLDAGRGDQLIVETLPFESVMNVEYPQSTVADPKTTKPTPDPEWLRQIKANSWGIPVAIGVLLLVLTIIWIVLRKIALFFMTRRKPSAASKKRPGMEGRPELPSANLMNTLRPENDKNGVAAKQTDQPATADGPAAIEAAKDSLPMIPSTADQELAFAENRKESIRRIHELVDKDMPGTIAVLRSWLHGEA